MESWTEVLVGLSSKWEQESLVLVNIDNAIVYQAHTGLLGLECRPTPRSNRLLLAYTSNKLVVVGLSQLYQIPPIKKQKEILLVNKYLSTRSVLSKLAYLNLLNWSRKSIHTQDMTNVARHNQMSLYNFRIQFSEFNFFPSIQLGRVQSMQEVWDFYLSHLGKLKKC